MSKNRRIVEDWINGTEEKKTRVIKKGDAIRGRVLLGHAAGKKKKDRSYLHQREAEHSDERNQ